MDFSHVHFYRHDSLPGLDRAIEQVSQVFPGCRIDVREPFLADTHALEKARVSDIMHSFEQQPAQHPDFNVYGRMVSLYDGFEVQRIFAQSLQERDSNHLQVIFTDILTCTFSEDDWRYHARAVVCGTPSIISTAGIVEAPAKPREFYMDPFAGAKRFAGRFIDYGDERMADAAAGYVLQAMFFFLTEGEPFCDSDNCRLYNAHWQEDLIRTQVQNPLLCLKHRSIASKFNRRLASRKSV